MLPLKNFSGSSDVISCLRLLLRTLTVTLTDTFNFVLLLDRVAVRASSGSVDELLGEALGHCFQVAETGLAGAHGQQVESVVDTTERRHIDSLPSHNSGSSHAGRVLTWAGIDNGVDHHLHRVLVRQKVDNF